MMYAGSPYDPPVAGLSFTAGEVPLVAIVPGPVFAFKTDRWRTESIPGPAGVGGIDIEADDSGQVVIVYSTRDSGLWCARGTDVLGVEESPTPQASSRELGPTILSGASGVQRLASSVVFDAMGRRVLNPRSGVYFVTKHGARGTVRARKVLIPR
jgi:hypothetical protein